MLPVGPLRLPAYTALAMALNDGDLRLFERCRAGDSAAWDTLVDRYRRLVWSVILKQRMRDGDAEDVFQQVFTALIEHIDSIRDEDGLASWLVVTTKRACWRATARLRRDERNMHSLDSRISDDPRATEHVDQHASHGDAESAETEQLLERQLVRLGLERLGGKCRALLEALFGAGSDPNYALISQRLDIRVGSIGPTRARCLEKLALQLRRLGFGPSLPAEAQARFADRDAPFDASDPE